MSVVRLAARLTGAANALPDLVLPLSSLRVTHRTETSSSFSAVVPTLALAADIAARPDGQLVVDYLDGASSTELMRGSLYDARFDVGGNSQSISLSGAPSQANPPEATHVLSGVSYRAWTSVGEMRLRAAPIPALRSGDTVIDGVDEYLVDTVTWNLKATGNSLQVQMEIATADPDAES